MDSLALTMTSVIFYVKYKQRESALRVFPVCFSHGVINYFKILRNVNETTKYIAKLTLDKHNYLYIALHK